MWLEEHEGKRINSERMDEACATGCATVGVACPYCLVMLDDGAKAKGEDTRVADVAQIVAQSVGTDLNGSMAGPAATTGADAKPAD
jgi:Fe-S oxidoreductase